MTGGGGLEPAMLRATSGRGTPADARRLADAIEGARRVVRADLFARMFPELAPIAILSEAVGSGPRRGTGTGKRGPE